MPLQDEELADQSLLFLTAQPAIVSTPQKPVPTPSPHHQPIDGFLRGLGQPREFHDVQAELVEYVPVFVIREANNYEFPNPVLGRLGFYLQPSESRQAMRWTTTGVVLEYQQAVAVTVHCPVESPRRAANFRNPTSA